MTEQVGHSQRAHPGLPLAEEGGVARSPLLQHEHHGGLPADIRDLLQEGEGALQLCVHDWDHQEGLVSAVCA